MRILPRKISVAPNHVAFLFRNNRLERQLDAGVYRVWQGFDEIDVISLPLAERVSIVTNQEVLTKDNIALRFSYVIWYCVADGQKFLQNFNVFQYGKDYVAKQEGNSSTWFFSETEQAIHVLSQIYLREQIAEIESEALNEKRAEIFAAIPDSLKNELAERGVEVTNLMLRDITFPKNIQDLFAKQLEAKIRGRADLENARTAVATARALKNASELMKDDENIKFMQMLETITKIAEKGKHTFVFGDVSQIERK